MTVVADSRAATVGGGVKAEVTATVLPFLVTSVNSDPASREHNGLREQDCEQNPVATPNPVVTPMNRCAFAHS